MKVFGRGIQESKYNDHIFKYFISVINAANLMINVETQLLDFVMK